MIKLCELDRWQRLLLLLLWLMVVLWVFDLILRLRWRHLAIVIIVCKRVLPDEPVLSIILLLDIIVSSFIFVLLLLRWLFVRLLLLVLSIVSVLRWRLLLLIEVLVLVLIDCGVTGHVESVLVHQLVVVVWRLLLLLLLWLLRRLLSVFVVLIVVVVVVKLLLLVLLLLFVQLLSLMLLPDHLFFILTSDLKAQYLLVIDLISRCFEETLVRVRDTVHLVGVVTSEGHTVFYGA